MRMFRLNPIHEPFWVTPTQLRFGVDIPLATLDCPSTAALRLLSAMTKGISESRCIQLAAALGVSRAERIRMLEELTPVFEMSEAADSANTNTNTNTLISGPASVSRAMGSALSNAGFTIVSEGPTQLVILCSNFSIRLGEARRWMSGAVPHLPVVFSETQIRIGPLITSSGAPCAYCIELRAAEESAHYIPMASQFVLRSSPLATAATSHLIGALLARLLTSAATDLQLQRHTLVASQAENLVGFEFSWRQIEPHPNCDCHQALTRTESLSSAMNGEASRRLPAAVCSGTVSVSDSPARVSAT